jgi:Tfp pilus assembly protein PilF
VLAHYTSLALAKNPQALDPLVGQLNIQYWVEGSVTEANERIRVLVRLIEKKSNKAVWTEVYEDDMQQLLTLNARIISDINAQLFGQSAPANFTAPANNVDINAYRAYLQGNYWWMNGKTSEWFTRAEASFLSATERAPNFAAAFGSLAFIYARYNYHDIYMVKADAVAKATAAIDKALQLDPNDINALLASALLAIEDLQFDQAQLLLNKVLRVDPSNTQGLYVYSEWALAKNKFDEALTYADKALQIDPLSPWINVNKAIVHFWRNEMTQALTSVEQAIDIDPNYTWAYVWKAKILSQKGQLSDAIEAMRACLKIDDGSQVNSTYLALLYTKAGMPEQAQRWFAHTASLYGDTPDARFWQSYSSFIKQKENTDIALQLINQVTLKTTRFFSLVPLQKDLLTAQPLLIKQALVEFLAIIARPNQTGFWVNHRNQYCAYAALALMQQLDSVEYEPQIALLHAQIKAFEHAVVLPLRANSK